MRGLNTITFVVIAICILACEKKSQNAETSVTKNKPGIPKVAGMLLLKQSRPQTLNATGSLVALDQVELSLEVPGKISQLNIPEGKSVTKGQLLVQLNDAELQAQLNKLNIQETLAIEKEKRKKQLLGSHGISVDEYESSLNELNVIRADIKIVERQIEKTKLHAPFSGVIGFKKHSEGAYIQAGTSIATLVRTHPIAVEFLLPENQSIQIRNGQNIQFQVEGLQALQQATIYAFEPLIETNSRSLRIRARCENPNNYLKVGAFARIALTHHQNEKVIRIPNETLVPVLKGYKVYLFKGGQVKEQIVQTSYRDEQWAIIANGLQEGDTLITTGIMRLKEGMPVDIKSMNQNE